MERLQKNFILQDFPRKIALIVGPRQSGKTWLAKDIAREYTRSVYLNYDQIEDRFIIKNQAWRSNTELLILDELHKMPEWKNYLKGVFDTKPEKLAILVTGSARLDFFKNMGDSLAGRYFTHHLLPFSLAELQHTPFALDLDRLISRGGFPEPFLAESESDANRWRMQYIESMVGTEVLSFQTIDHLKSLQLIFELLRTKVGSPISYQSIAEDTHVSPNTVKKYIQILEALYIIFRITPFSKNIARSLLKEPKIYFFDTGLVKGDMGAKLENITALSLLKHVYAKRDYEGKDCALHYLRTKDGIEIDFALAEAGEITEMLEVKTKENNLHPALKLFHEKYDFKATQLVYDLRKEKIMRGVEIIHLAHFLSGLKL